MRIHSPLRTPIILLLILLSAALAGCGSTKQASDEEPQDSVTVKAESAGIFSVSTAGADKAPLLIVAAAGDESRALDAQFSRDGKRLSWTYEEEEYEPRMITVRDVDAAPDTAGVAVKADKKYSAIRMTWHEASNTYAFLGYDDSRVYTLNAQTGAITVVSRDGETADRPAISPDGKHVAYIATNGAGKQHIVIGDVNGVAGEYVELAPEGGWAAVAWSPDGSQLAATRQGDTGKYGVVLVDAKTGAVTDVGVPQDGTAADPAWSPDGESIVIAWDPSGVGDQFGLGIVDVSDGTVTAIDIASLEAASPTFSPDGSSIAFSGTPVTSVAEEDINEEHEEE